MLVHICCSVDSHFFLQKVRELYPKEKLIGYFYNPNIHPYSEYYLRLLDVKRSCEMLGIELIEGEYDYQSWIDFVRGYEKEPEKGKRCTLCFDKRVEKSMQKALEIGEKRVTTTLLVSPKKSIEQLEKVGKSLAKRYGLEFLSIDLRAKGGTQEQFKIAKRDKLYHQDYCGCLYALKPQRESQDRVADELFSPVGANILPKSLQERIDLYEKRLEAEKSGKKYEITKEKFINYRLLRAYIKREKEVIPSYFLSYSYIKRKRAKLKIEKSIKDIYLSNRESVKIITIERFNEISGKKYKNVKELLKKPLSFKEENILRARIEDSFYSISPIVVVDRVDFESFEIYCDSTLYHDVRENLVIF